MKPRERRETGQNDLFKARLDQIIDMRHPRVRLAQAIDWRYFEQAFGVVHTDGPGSPPFADGSDDGCAHSEIQREPLG